MRTNNVRQLWLIILLVIFISSCVSKDVKRTSDKPVFYPPPPDLPRYQFLTSFRGTDDFGDEVSGLDSFLGSADKGYWLRKPYGVATTRGAMYVIDTQSSVYKWDFVNERVAKIPGDKGLGKLVQPINLDIDDLGNKYVADPVRSAVIKYDKKGFFIKAYNSPNSWKPVACRVYGDLLYVVDSTHRKGGVNVFDIKTGEIVEKFGQSGQPEHRLQIPTNIAFDSEGYIYVMDAGRFQVVKYDRDGHYRGKLGEAGDGPGFFGRPRGVAVDRDDRIYTVDAAFDVVQVFNSNGQLLIVLGGPGTAPGTLTLPAGVAIDYDNVEYFEKFAAPGFEIEYLVYVTSQFHDTNGISVYGFGKMSQGKYLSDDMLKEEQLEKLKNEVLQNN